MTDPFDAVVFVDAGAAFPLAALTGPALASAATEPKPWLKSTAGASVESEVDEMVGDKVVATVLFRQADDAAIAVVDELNRAVQLSLTSTLTTIDARKTAAFTDPSSNCAAKTATIRPAKA